MFRRLAHQYAVEHLHMKSAGISSSIDDERKAATCVRTPQQCTRLFPADAAKSPLCSPALSMRINIDALWVMTTGVIVDLTFNRCNRHARSRLD